MQSSHSHRVEISEDLLTRLEAIPDKRAGISIAFTPEMDAAILAYYDRKPKKQLAKALGVGTERLVQRYRDLKAEEFSRQEPVE